MNSKLKLALIALGIIAALAIILVLVLSLGGGEDAPEPTPEDTAPVTVAPAAEPTDTPSPEQSEAPANTVSATIAVGGDIVMHTGLNGEALTADGYDYTPIFGVAPELISGADYAVCSLVTSLPGAGSEYTAYPLFRSPDAIASSVAAAGFDLVNTATSHLADSWKDGIDHTLDVLDAAGLAHVGTYRSQAERNESGNRTTVDINGVSVAFLAYTCDTNSVPVTGFEYAASICATDYLGSGTDIDYALIEGDIAAAREAGADAVFVFMSWGTELSTQPDSLQEEMAGRLVAAGADVIIGGRCRVPQPMEELSVRLEDGTERRGFVCYSLGNLLSCQNDEYTDISAILNLTLTKDLDSGVTTVSAAEYRPIYMADLYDYGINDFDWHYRLVDLHAAIDAWDNGTPWDFMTDEIYADMVTALAAAHEFFGTEYDPAWSGSGE
ncbi:MAG TPA: CapA family protein [Candidatus Scatomorpha merdipullorum]|uniref:CapA family protein n=1 Tax=Candidatus Scatomorpha merdipullorum TaxID=2840927 RepID=A0A9D1FF30_9FIRM|nr:CapA family protein [Candidatus Scatomorpha merdipullorum]